VRWVAFRTVSLEDEDGAEFQRRFDAEIARGFDAAITGQSGAFAAQGGIEKVRNAQARFRVMWVAEPDLMGAEEVDVAHRYRQIVEGDRQGVSRGLLHSACLMVDAACVHSLMDAQVPSPKEWDEMRNVPFVRALSSHIGAEGSRDTAVDGERDSFNVAVLSLVNEFFVTIGGEIQDLGEVGAGVAEGQVWCSGSRYGILTPGKGFRSDRKPDA
jgi:hypothetical protein